MARSMVGVLLAAVAAAVPVLMADVHGSAIIMLAILAAGSGGGIYILASKKSASAAAPTSSAQDDASTACISSALKKMPSKMHVHMHEARVHCTE